MSIVLQCYNPRAHAECRSGWSSSEVESADGRGEGSGARGWGQMQMRRMLVCESMHAAECDVMDGIMTQLL